MMNVYPAYLENFICIASECRHSCCVGWEIDIDDESLERFKSTSGALGEKLSKNISVTGDGAQFVLTYDERCPFLMQSGLCELICEKGSDFLCGICADHPRFRNFFTDVTDTGLGLCCEEAARLILSNENKVIFKNTYLYDSLPDDEKYLVSLRGKMIEAAQNRALSSAEAEGKILSLVNAHIAGRSSEEWADIIEGFERLSAERDEFLSLLRKSRSLSLPAEHSVYAEQLAVYMLFRHIPDSLYDGCLRERTSFCMLAVRLIMSAFSASDGKPQSLYDIARIFSSEIEYSDENLQKLIEMSM